MKCFEMNDLFSFFDCFSTTSLIVIMKDEKNESKRLILIICNQNDEERVSHLVVRLTGK
jgi:hypothetical protein